MKTLVLLLSIIVLVLSIAPCSACDKDKSICEKDCKETSKHCDNNCKACSPFYSCGTCIGFVFPYSISINLPKEGSKISLKEIVYQDVFISSFANTIWQPPKIA